MGDRSPNNKGFTLLELLVAMAILTIVAVTAMNNNSAMIANTEYLKEKTIAHWVAMNKAAELRLKGRFISNKGEKGVEVMADQRWRWKAAGKRTPDPDIQLVRIEIRPDNDDPADLPLTELTIYLGRPSGYKIN